MGAVTALLFSHKDPSIAGVVVDSPFARLTDLMLELVEEQRLPIPKFFMKSALNLMKRSVKRRAGFDLSSVSPIDVVASSFVPALFGHAEGDTFINKRHSTMLHEAYGGDKNLILFEGDHNAIRPSFFYTSVVIFFHNVLRLKDPLEDALSTSYGLDVMPDIADDAPLARSPAPRQATNHSSKRGSSAEAGRSSTGNEADAPSSHRTGSQTHTQAPQRAGSLSSTQSSHWAGSQEATTPVSNRTGSLSEAQASFMSATPGSHWAGSQPGTPATYWTANQSSPPASLWAGSLAPTPGSLGPASPDSHRAGSQHSTPASHRYPEAFSRASSSLPARQDALPDMRQPQEHWGAAGQERGLSAGAEALPTRAPRPRRDTLSILKDIIPEEFRKLSLREAEERMLEEAISASLREDEEDAAAAAASSAGRPGPRAGPGATNLASSLPPQIEAVPRAATMAAKRWAASLLRGTALGRPNPKGSSPRSKSPAPGGGPVRDSSPEPRWGGFMPIWKPLVMRSAPSASILQYPPDAEGPPQGPQEDPKTRERPVRPPHRQYGPPPYRYEALMATGGATGLRERGGPKLQNIGTGFPPGYLRPLNLAEAVTQRTHRPYSNVVMESSDTPRGPFPPSILLDSAPFVPHELRGDRAATLPTASEDGGLFDIVGFLDTPTPGSLVSREVSLACLEAGVGAIPDSGAEASPSGLDREQYPAAPLSTGDIGAPQQSDNFMGAGSWAPLRNPEPSRPGELPGRVADRRLPAPPHAYGTA
eukprot:jgi/Botrbrau1/22693/Bobra.0132s0034.1